MVQEKKQQEKDIVKNKIPSRGRVFEGEVIRKFHKRIVIELERTVYVPKYERFYKKRTRLHARLPDNLSVEIGDYIKIRECRPLSKLIHFIVIGKVKSSSISKEIKK